MIIGRMLLLILVFLSLVACGGGGGGSDSGGSGSGAGAVAACTTPITAHSYLMSFHACNTSTTDCSDPQNHVMYLASSDDGASWSLIPEFTARAGSVPDVAMFQDYLYLFHAGAAEDWVKLNACLGVVDSGNATLSGGTDTSGFVDPSLIVNGSELEMFYLPGVLGQDPAGCATYPCTKEIHSSTTSSGDTTALTQKAGARASESLTSGSFSDPDIVTLDGGSSYILYVSAGQSTLAYTATSLDTQFVSPNAPAQTLVSNNSGGVPSGIQVGSEVWLYVTTNQGGKEVIRRGVSSDGITQISGGNFSTVVDASIFGGSASDPINVSSPSVISWPSSSWTQ